MSIYRSKISFGPTRRELAVLELVAQGLGNRQVAEILKVSERTVASHISNLISKTGCNSRMTLVIELINKGHLKPIGTNDRIKSLELRIAELEQERDLLNDKLKTIKDDCRRSIQTVLRQLNID